MFLRPLECLGKWPIMLWTKSFRPFFGGIGIFTKSSLLGKMFGGGITIRWVIFYVSCFSYGFVSFIVCLMFALE